MSLHFGDEDNTLDKRSNAFFLLNSKASFWESLLEDRMCVSVCVCICVCACVSVLATKVVKDSEESVLGTSLGRLGSEDL